MAASWGGVQIFDIRDPRAPRRVGSINLKDVRELRVVHNTAYIVGHLHLTVGTAVTLSFMGITYWLVPMLGGRALWSRRLALVQVWLWVGGMVIFSNALHRLGLMGMPRRTMIGAAAYIQPEWKPVLPLVEAAARLHNSAPYRWWVATK